jgi:hypothetical protein
MSEMTASAGAMKRTPRRERESMTLMARATLLLPSAATAQRDAFPFSL